MKTKRKSLSDKPNQGKSIPKKMNPFEIHINRSKHQVLGRKLKSDQGLPGISKDKAIQKRKKTLLQEYKMKGKNNNFIDQRIGERNSNMTEDDRIMARFTAERMRMFNKKAMFNLSDSEVLTHRGQTLSEIEKFEDIKSDDEEDDVGSSGALKRKFVEEAHFGGGVLTKNNKDRESLIDELINESKKRKAERQRNKEETLEATEQLDEDWKTLGLIVTAPKDPDDLANTQKKDDYDVVMRQLRFEPQGQASQRLKTDEEVAKEDKEQLEKLEKERLKQLREIEADKYKNHRSADDLDDGFSYSVEGFEDKVVMQKSEDESSDSSGEEYEDEKDERSAEESQSSDEAEEEEEEPDNDKPFKKKESKNKITKLENIEDSNEYTKKKEFLAEEDDETEMSPDTESSDEECAMDDLTDLMPSIIAENVKPKLPIQEQDTSKYEAEMVTEDPPVVELDLPYIIKVPNSYEDFKETIGIYAPQQLSIIFERLVKSNHPNLDQENKRKMLNLAEFIIRLVAEGELCWGAVPVLVTHFNHIKAFNREACLNLLLQSMPSAELSTSVMKFVVWYCLVFLKPEGMEMLLPVSRPVLALVCQIMSQIDQLSPTHLLVGLLCSYLLLQDAKSSSTLYLEPLKFLHDCINSCCEDNSSSPKESQEIKNSLVKPQDSDFKSCVPDNLRILITDLDIEGLKMSEISEQVLSYALILLSSFVKVYRKYPQSKIMFMPLQLTINKIKMDGSSKHVQEEMKKLKELLEVLHTAKLPSLIKEAKKPKALRQYEPVIYAVTVGKSNYGLPADKREEQKLLHKYKQEMKGAMRELRRDRVFIANLKLKERIYSDEQRVKKVKEIFGSAAEQQGELRKLKRKK